MTPGTLVPPTPTAKPETPFQIFAAGEWGGEEFTPEFLRAAVANWNKYQSAENPIGFPKVPAVLFTDDDLRRAGVQVGHEDTRIAKLARDGLATGDMTAAILAQALMAKTDMPASGWVDSLHMIGDAVLCTLDGVPVPLAADCNAGLYRYCSAEWYRNYKGASGREYGPMLRRVAILGGELPELKTLGRLPPMVFSESPALGGSIILCFSEVRPVGHDELVIALSAFIPNVAALVEKGFSDEQLATLLDAMKTANPDPGPTGLAVTATPAVTDGVVTTSAEDMTKKAGVAACAETKPTDPNVAATFTELRRLQTSLQQQYAISVKQNAVQESYIKRLATENRNKDLADVQAFCEQAVREGRMPPHELNRVDGQGKPKPNIVDRLMAMDGVNQVFTFGEKKLTLREMEMAAIRDRNPVRTFSEKLDQPGGPAAINEQQRVDGLAATVLGRHILDTEARAAGKRVTADGRNIS